MGLGYFSHIVISFMLISIGLFSIISTSHADVYDPDTLTMEFVGVEDTSEGFVANDSRPERFGAAQNPHRTQLASAVAGLTR